MTRIEAHCGILQSGIASAAITVTAASLSARALRDEAADGSGAKAATRYIAVKLEAAATLLAQAQARLDDLQKGDS